jgi:hypothetical protein
MPIFDTFDLSYEFYLRNMGAADASFSIRQADGTYPDVPQFTLPPGLTPREYYDRMISVMRTMPLAVQSQFTFGYHVERQWYSDGSPEYRVHEACIDALSATNIDVPTRFLKFPFDSFLVRFPKNYTRENESTPALRAMLVTTLIEAKQQNSTVISDEYGGLIRVSVNKKDAEKVRKLVMFLCFNTSEGDPSAFNFVKFPIADGDESLETAFSHALLRSEDNDVQRAKEREARNFTTPFAGCEICETDGRRKCAEHRHPDDGYWPSRDFYHRLLKIAAGVVFFATGASKEKLIEQVKLPRAERKRIARESGERARDVERPVYEVGRALILPRPEVERGVYEPDGLHACAGCQHVYAVHGRGKCPIGECVCSGFDTGRHLSYGYIRTGHWHFYCIGPKKEAKEKHNYVLRWVAPTIVRADLPLKPTKKLTYEVRAPRGEVTMADPSRIEEAESA